MSAAPGWYPDPWSPVAQRWWDGVRWAGRTRPGGDAPTDVPAGIANTVWIWLIIAIQAVDALLMLLLPWGSFFAVPESPSPFRMLRPLIVLVTSPAYWLRAAFGWAGFGVALWAAYRDHRELLARGVVKPLPWVLVVLGVVFPIARSVVVLRRTGRGRGPLWGGIVSAAISLIVATVILVEMFVGVIAYVTATIPDGLR